jgi:hypothetical protein
VPFPRSKLASDVSILNSNEWVVFCEHCHAFREITVTHQRDPDENNEYFELVCQKCNTTLLDSSLQQDEQNRRAP